MPDNQLVDRREYQSEVAKRLAIVFAVVILIIVVAIQAVLLTTLRNQGDKAVQQAIANGETAKRVVELVKKVETIATKVREETRRNRLCATPGTKCYDLQQANITDIVDNINNITLITVSCSDSLPSASPLELRACVVREISHQKGKR